MNAPSLSCKNLERHLGAGDTRLQVLRSVSLDLNPGEVHAVVGPSGCGKSTLLYLLGLLDTPDSGKILLQGENVAHLDENARSARRNACLGFIFQFHFLLQDFTALENVTIPMRRLGRLSDTEMNERAQHLLSLVGLERKTHRMSRQLSGGEQQRVAIARALANDPSVILADEPTGNLDSENSERVFDLLTTLARTQQKGILLVTHNPLIADRCDWVHEMKDGEIIRSTAKAGR